VAVSRKPEDLVATRRQIRQVMGGAEKIDALHATGRRTARDFIADFVDSDSFVELGTFAGMREGMPTTVAGDGRITGQAKLDGCPVGVIVDDVTVKRASSTALNARKAERVVGLAGRRAGMPVLYVGEAGGARLPETLRGEVFASEPVYPWLFDEDRPPLVTAIVGESYGGSSFVATMSDITVMLEGAVIALTSPRVINMATGASVSAEELGGAKVVASRTDLVDIVASDTNELDDVLRRALGFFTRPVVDGAARPKGEIRELVPVEESKPYDVHGVIDAILDVDSFLELGALRGRSIVTGLGRIDGRVVGIVASQPLREAGAMSPEACSKAERLTKLCDRFGFPMVSLVDTPGFQVGVKVEHGGMMRRAMDLVKTNTAARCPVVTLVLRKAFGLSFFAMFSPDHGGDVVLAWPGAQIGFMAPSTAASVLYGDELAELPAQEQKRRLTERAEALGASASALDVAAAMGIDEIVDERDTVATIRRYLEILAPKGAAS
jgi:acetyl-CoA carboxylase carboxyltransferase component